MININSYPQTIVDEKIKLLDRIRHELLSSLRNQPLGFNRPQTYAVAQKKPQVLEHLRLVSIVNILMA